MLAELTGGLRSLIFPGSCPGCAAPLTPSPDSPLCPACEAGLLGPALPWGPARGDSLDGALSPFLYEGACRRMILSLKYRAHLALVPFFAGRMAEEVRRRLGADPADCVIPVPLHPVRERERSFNQAERLAAALADRLGLPCRSGLLRRAEPTSPQTRLDRRQRWSNVRAAFTLREDHGLPGARILLVDDVLTTGSTAEACARLLKSAGARSVTLVTATLDPKKRDISGNVPIS